MAARPPEAELMLACACAEPGAEQAERVRALVAEGINWDRLEILLDRHGLRPLVARHLTRIAGPGIPSPVYARWWAIQREIEARNRAMARELCEVLSELSAQGIAAVPYKGPTLAVLLYGDVTLREFDDLDLILRKDDIGRAMALLAGRGFLPSPPLAPAVEQAVLASSTQYHRVLERESDDALLELHWKTDRLFPVERTEDPGWWASLSRVELDGQSLPALRPEELLLVLCVHGSKHRWGCAMWLADVAELARRHPSLDWQQVLATASRLRCQRKLLLGLEMVRRHLDIDLPAQVRDAIADNRAIASLAEGLCEPLFTDETFEPGPFRRLRIALGLHEGLGQKLALLHRVMFAPSLVEWARWPLPRPLHFAYPVLRWASLLGKHLRLAFRPEAAGP